jgi:hypothetical protein
MKKIFFIIFIHRVVLSSELSHSELSHLEIPTDLTVKCFFKIMWPMISNRDKKPFDAMEIFELFQHQKEIINHNIKISLHRQTQEEELLSTKHEESPIYTPNTEETIIKTIKKPNIPIIPLVLRN